MDREIELLVELLAGQVPQAPGSPASTLRALRTIDGLHGHPVIADLGCGRGASALILADATGAAVLAIDLLPPMVAATQRRAEEAALPVRAVVGDMSAPPIGPGNLDLVWSEGAAYSIGFGNALKTWRPLLKPGGTIALTELCWTGEHPPEECLAYWATAYPDMRDADGCKQAFREAGYELGDVFFLPEQDWSDYYEPMLAALPAFRAKYAGDELAEAVAADMETEAATRLRWGTRTGYLFLIGRRT